MDQYNINNQGYEFYEEEGLMDMISRKHAGLAALGLMTAVFLFFLTGYVHCKQAGSQPPVGHTAFIFGDAHSYVAESRLSFEGGYAVLGLYDTPAALEFSERQPLVVPLQRQGNRIVLPGLPPVVVPHEDATGMKPDIGDIAFDVNTRSLVIFCQKEEATPNLIPVGHVVGGMNYLLQTQGNFEGYLTKK